MEVSRRNQWSTFGEGKAVVAATDKRVCKAIGTTMRRLGVQVQSKAKHLGVQFQLGGRRRATRAMLELGGVPMVTINTFLSPAPPSCKRTRSCPDLGRHWASLTQEVQAQGLTTIRATGLQCRMRDDEALDMLADLGFPAGQLDFVFIPRRNNTTRPSTNYGYFFASCASSRIAASLIAVLEAQGFQCRSATVQGHAVNTAKFFRAKSAATGWVSQGGVWQRIERI